MDPLLAIARVLHIGLGAFWAGSVLFLAFVLDPSVRASGPAGGQVMGALAQRGLTQILLTAGFIAIASGIYLFYVVSGGFTAEYSRSAPGIIYSLGLVASVVAWCIGFFVSRPTVARMGALSASLAATSEDQRGAITARMGALRQRLTTALMSVATLLSVVLASMALARYV